MRIVAAGMHHPVASAAVGHAFLVVDKQGVDVAANRNPFSPSRRRIVGDDAAAVEPHANFEPRLIESLIKQQARFQLGPARLRMRVKMPAEGHQFGSRLIDDRVDGVFPVGHPSVRLTSTNSGLTSSGNTPRS